VNRGADTAISVCALTKRYGGGVVALDGIDLGIARGTATAILGANGSGKSTLVKILAGVLPADAGSISILGADAAYRPAALRARLGYVAQHVELDPEMTGAETLRLFATLHAIAPNKIQHRIAELTNAFGLREHAFRLVGTYSGGLRQRLHIAVGFVHDPQLVFLDEPTAALDPSGHAAVWHLVQRYRDEGRTLVLITHNTIDASRHCETIVLLHRGRVAASGSPHELVARHGSWTLELRLTRSIADDTALLERIASAIAATKSVVRGNRLILHFAESDALAALGAKSLVVGRLEAAGETVLGFRLDPPDLASAYFNLTDETIAPPEKSVTRRNAGAGAEGPGSGQRASVK
jgi:ABC-type multidrug transport system ATPase subunit